MYDHGFFWLKDYYEKKLKNHRHQKNQINQGSDNN